MKQTHAFLNYSKNFFVSANVLLIVIVLAVSAESQSISLNIESEKVCVNKIENSIDRRFVSEVEDRIKIRPIVEHIDGVSADASATDLVIPDSNKTFRDTFHHKNRLLTTPETIRELISAVPELEEVRYELSDQPKFVALEHRQHFKHYLNYREDTEDSLEERRTDDLGSGDQTVPSEKFHWRSAIQQSLLMQGVQHGYALVAQEKTRRALKGPFFRDYWRSLKGLSGWDDGNRFFTNYIAHPMQGAMTGFIYVQNHDRVKKQMFAESPQYWRDRLKVFVWSTAWSTNWELGPISQSSIGNLGMHGGMAYVDLVITPTVGTTWMMTEEALDRYVIRHIESKSKFVKIMSRMFLNPMRTTSNLLRFKHPWYRDRPFHH